MNENANTGDYKQIRNKNQKTAMQKPIIESHRFVMSLRVLRTGIDNKTGMDQ